MTLVDGRDLHDSGDAGGQHQLGGGDAGESGLPVTQGEPDDHLRRALERGLRNSAVHGERDGNLGTGGELQLDDAHGLHDVRHHRDSGGGRHLHNPGDAGRQHQLGGGDAGKSELQVTQGSQTITFGALSNRPSERRHHGERDCDLGIGGELLSRRRAVCTIAREHGDLVTVGTCTIQATQAGNTNWAAATPVNQGFR